MGRSPNFINEGAALGWRGRRSRSGGFTLPELVVVLLVGAVLTAIAVPVIGSAIASMRLGSTVSDISGAIAKVRYRAIMTSQPYSLVITAPANTYVVTNLNTNVADRLVPLSGRGVLLNGGVAAAYTFTLCPNGTVYGAGGCPGVNPTPALSATYEGDQTNITVSTVGNVSTKRIH
ncbi:MAG TPA: prepilin-type N-terminal cleavage/methylation domain-containing protein [Candidatus Acidoferrales bacterium]|nr:prepilin-type N-terminal cleavage/methylation domain-containing protein [Candidatus Acidoferrales bacterium]